MTKIEYERQLQAKLAASRRMGGGYAQRADQIQATLEELAGVSEEDWEVSQYNPDHHGVSGEVA